VPLSLISSTRLLVHPACLYRLLNRFFLDSACLAVFVLIVLINPSERKGNYSATLNIIIIIIIIAFLSRLRSWLQRRWSHYEVGTLGIDGCAVTARPVPCKNSSPPINGQTAPIAVLQYNGPLLCAFNVPIKMVKFLFSYMRSKLRSLFSDC